MMRRLGLEGRIVLAGAPAAAGLATTAALVVTGNGATVDNPVFAGAAAAVAASGIGLGVVVARRTVAALDRAIDAAEAVTPEVVLDDLSTAMATGKRSAPSAAAEVDPVSAPLAHMIDTLTATAVDAAYQHGETVRSSVNGSVVRLAMRNHGLLDRQLRLLDGLEDTELDPDGLDRLFQLDHLATQMRRRNDALMVLTTVESSSTDMAQVAVRDVLRGALSAVEQFKRVTIESAAVASLAAPVASDLALLLAEVIDNATSASHEETRVHVSAVLTPAGLVVSVADDGRGFSPAELREIDRLFRSASHGHLPLGSRGLGLVIAAQVAARHHLRVVFGAAPNGGGHVTIEVPATLVAREAVTSDSDRDDGAVPIVVAQARRHDRLTGRQQGAAGAGDATTFVDWQPSAPRVPPAEVITLDAPEPTPFQPVAAAGRPAPAGPPRSAAVPGGQVARPAGGPGGATGSMGAVGYGAPVGPPPGPAPAQPASGSSRGSDTLFRVVAPPKAPSSSLLGATDRVAVGGLVRRVPGATLPPEERARTTRPEAEPESGARDPEAIRARMTGYRDGVIRGRGGNTPPYEGR
jgi:signal transduction histidine kinase